MPKITFDKINKHYCVPTYYNLLTIEIVRYQKINNNNNNNNNKLGYVVYHCHYTLKC